MPYCFAVGKNVGGEFHDVNGIALSRYHVPNRVPISAMTARPIN